MNKASRKVIITATDYRKPVGTEVTIISRWNGMFVIDFGQGCGVLTADEFEELMEART